MSLTTTHTTTKTLQLPLCRCLNNYRAVRLPMPVVGVLGKKGRTSGAMSLRRFVVVPAKTYYLRGNVHVYTRICRRLGLLLERGKLSATIKSRNNFTPSLSSSRRILALVIRTVRGTKCGPKRRVAVTVSTTSDRLCSRRGNICFFPKRDHVGKRGVCQSTNRVARCCRGLIRGFPVISVRSNL